MKPQYCVIEDNQDEDGNGDYLHSHSADTYEEAKKLLDGDPKCTHIDYWDGTKYECHVDGPQREEQRGLKWSTERDEYGNWVVSSGSMEFKTEFKLDALWLLKTLNAAQ